MYQSMMATQQQQIIEPGFPAVRPMASMVRIDVMPRCAAGETATAVAAL
jgi:hypothetical protein